MRLLLIPVLAATALLGACDGDSSVNISSSTSRDDTGGVLKVVETLQCPDTMGSLTRKGSAQADGTVCTYSGPRGAEVSLHLVSLGEQDADTVLKAFETPLMAAMPHTMAQMNLGKAETARADAEAARGDAEAARADAEAARADATATDASGQNVSVSAPGMRVDARDDKASVHMPGISIDADGDRADIRIGGLTIKADDSTATVDGTGPKPSSESVSIQAHDDSAEIRTRAPGDATRQTWLLTDNRPSPQGWRLVGYEARGPRGGPIVVATVRAKDRNSDGVFDDAKDLVTLNVGK